LLAVDALFLRHLLFQPRTLESRIGELAKAVRKLDAAGINLEPLSEAGTGWLGPRERRLHSRIIIENSCLAVSEMRLESLDEHTAEHGAPAVVGRNAHACPARGCRKLIGGLGRQHSQKINPGMAAKCFYDRKPMGLGQRIDSAIMKREALCAGDLGCERNDCATIIRDGLPGLVRPIPFDQREFRVMQHAGLPVAEDAGKLHDALLSGRKQLLACK